MASYGILPNPDSYANFFACSSRSTDQRLLTSNAPSRFRDIIVLQVLLQLIRP